MKEVRCNKQNTTKGQNKLSNRQTVKEVGCCRQYAVKGKNHSMQ